MKRIGFSIIILLSSISVSRAQLKDTSLIKKFTVNGFCLCKTNLTDLRDSSIMNLKEVDVEEMDLPTGCAGKDDRFVSGKGYYSETQPGIIFQKDSVLDLISKIRLTKAFKGKLPDGNYIDLSNFLLKDLFKLYPGFKDKWKSRDCSHYWKFSNDTISFYVKMDSTKKMKFPDDKNYYLNKPVEGIDLVASCMSFYTAGDRFMAKYPLPIYIIDSVRYTGTGFPENLNPNDIGLLSLIGDSTARTRIGAEGKRGIIYIETKKFDKVRYWKYFSLKSPDYAKIVSSPGSDSSVQYILNNKVLKRSFEGTLSLITDKEFKSIQIINKEDLIKNYGITGKDYGVVITTNQTQ
ncbi:MAG: hypothetical protein ACHQHN_17695 [Sphingobacteriales bacterium]